MQKKLIVGLSSFAVLLMTMVMMYGVAAGAALDQSTDPPTGVQPESCATCHPDAGTKHQASYNELYQDGVIQVSDITYSFSAPDISTVSFKLSQDGAPVNAAKVDSLNIYFAPYTDSKFQFNPSGARLSLKGKLTYADGVTTSAITGTTDLSGMNGMVVIFGRDETIRTIPNSRVAQNKYPFAGTLPTGSGVDYVSPANNSGCENCHTTPYLKHGYIYGEINHDPGTDFYACKSCHLDDGKGEHVEWQLLVEDPALAASYLAKQTELTPEQETQYAYRTTLMNDVHMSHSMEFPYPQSMGNCVTCHEGKLDKVLTDANFTMETCKSCHPVNGSEVVGTDKTSIKAMLADTPDEHGSLDLSTETCTGCHREGEEGPRFKEIHSGYDKTIYTADGTKYSEAISVTIESATFADNKLDFKFSAAQLPDLKGIDVTTMVPTVMVGLYGYDTKDFIIGPHERLTDDNADGKIDNKDARALEYVVGTENPRYTTVSAENGSWEVTADLSQWADMIAGGTVKRVEIGVMPLLKSSTNITLALNAPSRTFDLTANSFADDFYKPIAKVTDGCNKCHDALATTFHTPDRGGNIVVCRMCHIPKAGGAHLEMQSRSIDSYIHAIHSFQAFDIANIDFADPVQAMEYQHHTETPYPAHGPNCESCHVAGTYDVPDQSKSLPGILSASAEIKGWDRNIGTVPSVVVGPAARACGACHRAELINEDKAGALVSFDQHTKQGGTMVAAGEDPIGTLNTVIDWIMGLFK